jgi:hypothetical protein
MSEGALVVARRFIAATSELQADIGAAAAS